VLEILCAMALISPALSSSFNKLAPIAAMAIAGEMLVFCALHIVSGNLSNIGPMAYWLIVAILCSIIAYGRMTGI
jgi:hypothetical protein